MNSSVTEKVIEMIYNTTQQSTTSDSWVESGLQMYNVAVILVILIMVLCMLAALSGGNLMCSL